MANGIDDASSQIKKIDKILQYFKIQCSFKIFFVTMVNLTTGFDYTAYG